MHLQQAHGVLQDAHELCCAYFSTWAHVHECNFHENQVLDSDYSFDEDGIYPSINYNDEDPHRSYMEQIETMPMTAGPGVFGLHENANIACALAETFVIFDTILLMEVGTLFALTPARSSL